MNSKKIVVVVLVVLIALTCISCNKEDAVKKELVIAEQYGLAYAPIHIMKEKGFLDEELEDYEVSWAKLGNAAAIREAIIAGELDAGFVGAPPFLIGYDKGTDWKIFSGLSKSPLGLVSTNSEIESIRDIDENMKIALPQPGSIQHMLLSMASKKEFGDAGKFDKQLLSMKHPDGMSALLASDEVELHFTSPPYLFKELADEKTHLVLDANEAFGGEFTFIVGVSSSKLAENEYAYKGLNVALLKAINFIKDNPEETIEILNEHYQYEEALLHDYVYNQGIEFSTEIIGLEKFIEFMHDNKMIDKSYEANEVIWEK